MPPATAQIPEVGQAVRVRNRLATVRAVEPYDSRDAQGRLHIVDVEYLEGVFSLLIVRHHLPLTHHFPLNWAARFSLKLCTPSTASSVANRRCCSGPISSVWPRCWAISSTTWSL